MERYDPQAIETKWQAVWEDEQAFVVPNPQPGSEPGPSTYVLEMLPYPSGELHMGHVFNYTLGDVFAHVRRRQGLTVLRPMGYDAFGLNAENAAIRDGGHPRAITTRNIEMPLDPAVFPEIPGKIGTPCLELSATSGLTVMISAELISSAAA